MNTDNNDAWREKVVRNARIMSQAKWSPVADDIPIRGGGEFKAGVTYTGVPYSNGGVDGRLIGFDVNLRTFLAAVENPHSVLYTKDLRGQRRNSAAFYGMVCSAFTSYSLQVAVQIASSFHGPPHREGVEPAHPQSAQGARAGDVLWFSGHVEIVTQVTAAPGGAVSSVRVEDSWPPTTRTKNYTAQGFDDYLAERKAVLYRINDYDAWRGRNRAEAFLFPDHAMDAAAPEINRVLLLDCGDWVAYRKDQPVMFNIMDRDGRGVMALVIAREGEEVERVAVDGPGIVARTFTRCGDYTARCAMKDGTLSQACEFSVCGLDSSLTAGRVELGKPWEIMFRAENMKAIHVVIVPEGELDICGPVAPYSVLLSEEHRRLGRVAIPAGALSRAGKCIACVTGENRYGRLKNRHVFEAV